MPETACLHIQARESDPVRVVDLPGNSARIGREAYCDVRLAEPDLADEECRLRLRGGAWQLVPVAAPGAARLDGRPVDGPTRLDFGATFHVGSHRLTLRPSPTSSPWADRPLPASVPASEAAVDESSGVELATRHRNDWESQGDPHDRWVRAQRETKRWETRWRAAGEKLRAASTGVPAVPPARPEVPTVEPRSVRLERLIPDALARRPEVRPAVPPGPALLPTSVPGEMPTRPAGYVPPAAPNARREPVRSSGWSDPPAPRRRNPPEPPVSSVVKAERRTPLAPEISDQRAETESEPSDSVTLLNGLGISRIEHDDLDTLISRLQTAAPGDAPAETVEPRATVRPENPDEVAEPLVDADEPTPFAAVPNHEPVDPVAAGLETVTEGFEARPYEPPVLATSPIDDEEDEDRTEPETLRRVLGATRRVARVSSNRPEPADVRWTLESGEPANAERTGPDTFQAGATRWVTHRPKGSDDGEGEGEGAGGWSYQVPFVTDTNIVEPGGPPGPASIVAGTAPLRDATRTGTEPRRGPTGDDRDGTDRASRDWPTVGEILAAQGVRPRGPATATRPAPKASARRPEPTAARTPRQWRLPIWLAWVPGTTLVLGVGLAGLSGAWGWSRDGFNAGIVAQRLSAAEPSKAPLPPDVVPPGGAWWTTSATHLVQWAAYLDRTGGPDRAAEARALLDLAARVAPLNPSVRYALAHPSPGESITPATALARSLGQSRDVPALAWAGRNLLAAGKRQAALRAFREAMEMGARADLSRTGAPAFLDDPQVRRYALPTEGLLAGVVREMAGSGAWSYKDWAGALPRGTAAAAIAARVLRESGSPDAEAALDAALAEGEAEPAEFTTASGSESARTAGAVRLAARAEALAMRQRWADARDHYRRAIDLIPVDALRRAWWLNLADLESRLDEEPERQKALEAAKVADLKDEITRRAVDLQRAAGAVARRQAGRGAGAGAETEARR